MTGSTPIGFSQRIQREWLDQTAQMALSGCSRSEIEEHLRGLLQNQLSVGGEPERGNREKAITILVRVWVKVPAELEPLRRDGLALFETVPHEDYVAVHWGMCMAAYPFFGVVGETVGRLLRLQGECTAAQVQRRIRERFGERETVARAARRILRSFIDWGVLAETERKGSYRSASTRLLGDRKLATWLVEAALRAGGGGAASLRALSQAPSLFPFDLGTVSPSAWNGSSRLELFRHGLDEDVVTLRSSASSIPG